MTIALTDNKTVAMLSHSAEVAAERGHRLFAPDEIEKPWPTFFDDIHSSIDAMNISYRVNRRITGCFMTRLITAKPHTIRRREWQGS